MAKMATKAKNPLKQKGPKTENPLKPKAPRHKLKNSYASDNPYNKGGGKKSKEY